MGVRRLVVFSFSQSAVLIMCLVHRWPIMFETLKTIHSFLRCRIIQTACNKTLAVESKNFCCQIELGMPVISSCLPAQQIIPTPADFCQKEKKESADYPHW